MTPPKPRQPYTMIARADSVRSTRDRIVQATLKLVLKQHYEDITLAAIAEAAGVSHQTVLNHFSSKEGAAAAAGQLLATQTVAARAVARPGDVTGAIRVLVGEYERIGDANARWAASSERLGSLASMLDDARAGHQAWLAHMFGKWLPTTPVARLRTIHALHAATDVYTWKLLRRDLRLTRRDTERTIVQLVAAILRRRATRHARPKGRTR